MNLGATRITGFHPQFLKTVAFLWRISSFWTIYVTTHLLKSSASRDVSKLTLPEDWYCSNRPSWIACCSLQFKAGRSFCHWVQSKPWKKYLVGGFNIFNPFENISQTGSSPQVVVKMKNIWVATTQKKNIDLSRIGFIIWRNSTFRLQQSNQQSHNLCSWMSSKKTVKKTTMNCLFCQKCGTSNFKQVKNNIAPRKAEKKGPFYCIWWTIISSNDPCNAVLLFKSAQRHKVPCVERLAMIGLDCLSAWAVRWTTGNYWKTIK